MHPAKINISGYIGGVTLNGTLNRSAVSQVGHSPALEAAQAGTLSTRTDEDEGILTLGADHGIQTADVIDLYWTVAGVDGRRYNVVVGTVAGTNVPFSGGSGDDLPVQDTAITAQKQLVIDTDFDGDKLEAIGALCGKRGHVSFYESGAVLALAVDLAAGEPWYWLSDGPFANPLAGKVIDYAVVTQAATTATTFKLGVIYNSLAPSLSPW